MELILNLDDFSLADLDKLKSVKTLELAHLFLHEAEEPIDKKREEIRIIEEKESLVVDAMNEFDLDDLEI